MNRQRRLWIVSPKFIHLSVSALLILVAVVACNEGVLPEEELTPSGQAVTMIHVDDDASFPGNGERESPFVRITDALDLARSIRLANNEMESAITPIIIKVAPGHYVGSFDAVNLANDPTLEALPLVLNIPKLVLAGSTEPQVEISHSHQLPTGTAVAGTETVIMSLNPLDGRQQALVLIVATTDGMTGNATAVEGLLFDSGQPPTGFGGAGVVASQVRDYEISQNIFGERFANAIFSHAASGALVGNFMTHEFSCAICLVGPGEVNVVSNRALESVGGIFIASTAIPFIFPLDLGTQEDDFEINPVVVPASAHLSGQIVDNDLSGHNLVPQFSFGLRLAAYGPNTASVIEEQSLDFQVSKNRIHDNAFGVHIDAGFPFRDQLEAASLPPTGDVTATFSKNDVENSCHTPMLLSFTRNTATLGFPGQAETFAYLQDSTFDIAFGKGDSNQFKDFWVDHPIEDPFDDRELNNTLLINGREIAPPEFFAPFDPTRPCG